MGEYEDMYADDPALLSLSEHVRGLRERLESSTLDCTGALRRMDWLQLALHAADKPELDAAELCGLMLQVRERAAAIMVLAVLSLTMHAVGQQGTFWRWSSCCARARWSDVHACQRWAATARAARGIVCRRFSDPLGFAACH